MVDWCVLKLYSETTTYHIVPYRSAHGTWYCGPYAREGHQGLEATDSAGEPYRHYCDRIRRASGSKHSASFHWHLPSILSEP